jgi:GNAT superfamily N-acetyltransferase
MSTQWRIRSYQQDDEEAVLRLRRICFRGDDSAYSRERYRWLWRNPYGCYGWVAVVAGEVIGFEGRLLAPLEVLTGRTLASIGFDLMVAPRYRGKGIGRALVSTSRQEIQLHGVAVSLGFTYATSSRVSEAAHGLLLGDLLSYFRSATSFGRFALKTWSLRHPLESAGRLDLRCMRTEQLEVEPFSPNAMAFGRLALEDTGLGDIHIVRTVPWLDWSCLQCPRRDTRFLIVRSHGELVGFVTYSIQRLRGLLSLGRVEHFASPRSVPETTAENALLNALLSVRGVDLWWSRAFPESQYGQLLNAIGFHYCYGAASHVTVAIPKGCSNETALVDRSRWYLSPSDMF